MNNLVVLVGFLALAVGAQATAKNENKVPSCYRLQDKEWQAGDDGFWYKYYRLELPFAEARAICIAQGGDLAMEKTKTIRDYIHKTFQSSLWVGIVRSKSNGAQFTFVDGTPITWSWWAKQQPSNTGGNENCVLHWKQSWDDRDCSVKNHFLCQKKDDYACEKDEAKATMLDQATTDKVHVPLCEKDNSFAAKQCTATHCFCVQKDGTSIKGSKRPIQAKLDCVALRKGPSKLTECQKKASAKGAFKPRCDADGAFSTLQCFTPPSSKAFCWCSLGDGTLIPDTVHDKGAKDAPNCGGHRDLVYDCTNKAGTYPHPFDKTRFMYCYMHNVFSCHCPKGLIYPQKPHSDCGPSS